MPICHNHREECTKYAIIIYIYNLENISVYLYSL